MKPDQLKSVLDRHAAWLRGEAGGERADLSGADLSEASLREANLRKADLRWADLRGANLRRADLRGANLRGADLRGAYLCGARLREAALSGADLHGADLRGAYLCGADLRWADLRGANLRRAALSGADLTGTGVLRLQGDYEATLYPGGDLDYGCERMSLDEWEANLTDLCERHRPERAVEFERKLRVLIALCRAHQEEEKTDEEAPDGN